MMLKKRAAGAIAVAISMVVMTIAADVATEQQMDRETVTAETDLATNGIAGIAVAMSQYEAQAYQYMELDSAQVARTDTVRVAAAEEGEDTEEAVLTEETVQPEADETAVQNSAEESSISEENSEEAEWENRLMADVNEFLYVRADASADAEIVGKLYKGDVADIQETGEEWTHITSGNVDGFVNNDYCVTGNEAASYAAETVDTQAAVLADGLRIRSEADAESSVQDLVSTGYSIDDGEIIKFNNFNETISDTILLNSNIKQRKIRVYILWNDDEETSSMTNEADTLSAKEDKPALLDVNISFTQVAE